MHFFQETCIKHTADSIVPISVCLFILCVLFVYWCVRCSLKQVCSGCSKTWIVFMSFPDLRKTQTIIIHEELGTPSIEFYSEVTTVLSRILLLGHHRWTMACATAAVGVMV